MGFIFIKLENKTVFVFFFNYIAVNSVVHASLKHDTTKVTREII